MDQSPQSDVYSWSFYQFHSDVRVFSVCKSHRNKYEFERCFGKYCCLQKSFRKFTYIVNKCDMWKQCLYLAATFNQVYCANLVGLMSLFHRGHVVFGSRLQHILALLVILSETARRKDAVCAPDFFITPEGTRFTVYGLRRPDNTDEVEISAILTRRFRDELDSPESCRLAAQRGTIIIQVHFLSLCRLAMFLSTWEWKRQRKSCKKMKIWWNDWQGFGRKNGARLRNSSRYDSLSVRLLLCLLLVVVVVVVVRKAWLLFSCICLFLLVVARGWECRHLNFLFIRAQGNLQWGA